jgi:phage-related protein
VQDEAGYDLWIAQQGGMPSTAKVMKGFGGADVMELVENYDSDTYRVVYTVRFKHVIYVPGLWHFW